MEIRKWDERYRLGDLAKEDSAAAPNPLLVETASKLVRGRALDLACGAGRNAIWLAEQGWDVTAVDGAPGAIEILRRRAAERGLTVKTRVVNLANADYPIEPDSWDLIAMCFYLQRSLFDPAKQGIRPGGVVLAIVHIANLGEKPTEHQLSPGELETYFSGWEILYRCEGMPNDLAHKRPVAEMVARRPVALASRTLKSGRG
jgi:tellurite methyltransferase